MSKTINQWVQEVYAAAKAKGWWESSEPKIKQAIADGITVEPYVDKGPIVDAIFQTLLERKLIDTHRRPAEIHALVTTEVAEATEAVRSDDPPVFQLQGGMKCTPEFAAAHNGWNPEGKPEGEAIELADAVIRIMDYFGHKGWDLDETIRLKVQYNNTRSHRHGGKVL